MVLVIWKVIRSVTEWFFQENRCNRHLLECKDARQNRSQSVIDFARKKESPFPGTGWHCVIRNGSIQGRYALIGKRLIHSSRYKGLVMTTKSLLPRLILGVIVLLVLIVLHVIPLPILEVLILYVMIFRPPWFKNLVDEFYSQ